MPAGRLTKYQPEYAEQAAKLCALGAIDVQLADFFGVCEKTLNNWKKDHPEFLQSIAEAKNDLDSKVERSLFERATGYSHPDTHFSNYQGTVTQTATVKHYPPDTTAAMYWLNNRQSDRWRSQRHVDHTSDGKSISQMTTAQLEAMVADAE